MRLFFMTAEISSGRKPKRSLGEMSASQYFGHFLSKVKGSNEKGHALLE